MMASPAAEFADRTPWEIWACRVHDTDVTGGKAAVMGHGTDLLSDLARLERSPSEPGIPSYETDRRTSIRQHRPPR